MKPDAERHKNTNKEMSRSKAKYHVPQPGEVVEFITKRGLRARVTVSSWDAKHGVIVSTGGLHYAVGDRSTIKPVTPVPVVDAPEPRPRTEGHPFRACSDASDEIREAFEEMGNTVTLPTSFASEVERAKAIADAEAEEKKRSEKVIDEMNRLADEIVALTNKRRDVMAANEDEEEDHQLRVNYLRSLRVRGEK